MCNAHNHDPWCPCGWGPVRGLLGDKTSDELCTIFSPFNPLMKKIYDAAHKPVEDIANAYRNMGKAIDKSAEWEKESKKLDNSLRNAVGKMEAYEKDSAELVKKLGEAGTEEERKQISDQIAQLDKSIDEQIKAAGVEHRDASGGKHAVKTLADLKNYFGADSKTIWESGMKEYYEDIGACDGFVRDKMLRDVMGVDLNNCGSDVTGIKDLFNYCKNNKVDSQMFSDVTNCLENDDKEGFKTALSKIVFPGSILFRSGGGSGGLHGGVVQSVKIENGKIKSIVMVHASRNALEATDEDGNKTTGGVKKWEITVNELWKSGAIYKHKYENEDGEEQEEEYRRLFISNIGLHKNLEQNE